MALETQWINEKFHADLDNEIISELSNFLIFWSLFEGRFCRTRADRNSLLRFSETNYSFLSNDEINHIYGFFKNRYSINENYETRFDGLKITSPEIIVFLRETFSNENATVLDKLKVCINVIYRYRNNMFHGSKEVAFLHNQTEIFVISNRFLKHILNTLIL